MGRTEVIRSTSRESLDFVKAMTDPLENVSTSSGPGLCFCAPDALLRCVFVFVYSRTPTEQISSAEPSRATYNMQHGQQTDKASIDISLV